MNGQDVPLRTLLWRNRRTVFLLAGISAVGLALLLVLWDQLTWPYLWGPVVADARDASIGDVRPGYNPINTIFYGLVMAVAVFYVYKMLRALGVEVDIWLFLALAPYVWLGGSVRALEDSGLFNTPTTYLFIAPIIYFAVGFSAIAVLLMGVALSRMPLGRARLGLVAILASTIPGYAIVVTALSGHFNYVFPIPAFASLAILSLAIAWSFVQRRGKATHNTVLFFTGLPFASMAMALVLRWLWGERWSVAAREMYPYELALIAGIALIATAIVYLAGRIVSRRDVRQVLTDPMNVAIVFGHLLDAAATYRGIDGHGYVEKHVLPSFLIEATGTAAVMFPLKVGVIVFALWLIDVGYREELRDNELLKNLVKFAIFVLGVAPGIRDSIRLAMGV